MDTADFLIGYSLMNLEMISKSCFPTLTLMSLGETHSLHNFSTFTVTDSFQDLLLQRVFCLILYTFCPIATRGSALCLQTVQENPVFTTVIANNILFVALITSVQDLFIEMASAMIQMIAHKV